MIEAEPVQEAELVDEDRPHLPGRQGPARHGGRPAGAAAAHRGAIAARAAARPPREVRRPRRNRAALRPAAGPIRADGGDGRRRGVPGHACAGSPCARRCSVLLLPPCWPSGIAVFAAAVLPDQVAVHARPHDRPRGAGDLQAVRRRHLLSAVDPAMPPLSRWLGAAWGALASWWRCHCWPWPRCLPGSARSRSWTPCGPTSRGSGCPRRPRARCQPTPGDRGAVHHLAEALGEGVTVRGAQARLKPRATTRRGSVSVRRPSSRRSLFSGPRLAVSRVPSRGSPCTPRGTAGAVP